VQKYGLIFFSEANTLSDTDRSVKHRIQMKSRLGIPSKKSRFGWFGEIVSGLWQKESWIGAGILIIPLLLFGVFAHFFFSESAQIIATTFFINLIAVLGYYTFIGTTGVGVFGHVAFTGIAAHLVALLTLDPAIKTRILPNLPSWLSQAHFGFWPALLITLLAVGFFAFLIGIPFSRMKEAPVGIVTLCFLVMIYNISVVWTDITRGVQPIDDLPRYVGLWKALLFAVGAIIAARFFRDSIIGLKLGASAQEKLAAQSLGVDVPNLRLLAWTLSALFMAITGVLLAHHLTVVIYSQFYLPYAFTMLAMLIVGGAATVSGAVVGAAFMTIAIEILRWLGEGPQIGPIDLPEVIGLTMLGLGVSLIIVMFWRREGIVGYSEIDEHITRWRRLKKSQKKGPKSLLPAKYKPAELVLQSNRNGGSVLSVKGATKDFGGLRALADIDLELSTGQILGLIGPNGSGKTTLINVITGALYLTKGTINVDETDISLWAPHKIARLGVGRTFQAIKIFPAMSVLHNIMAGAVSPSAIAIQDPEERAYKLLYDFGLEDYAFQAAGELPYGPQRTLEIARAVALDPLFLMLDEPAAGMIHQETDALVEVLRRLRAEYGIGLLVVDHDLPMIMRLCDQVVVLNEGRVIASGMPEEIQQNPDVIEAYIGKKRSQGKNAIGA
jgi:branched-chain amino acid transport system permease protein